jgi:hypothetical protein
MQKNKSKVVGQVDVFDEGGDVPAPPLCTNPDGSVTQCPERTGILSVSVRPARPREYLSLLKKGLRFAENLLKAA